MKASPFDYLRADDVTHAVALLAASDGGFRPAAGTQSLGAMLNLRLAAADGLVDVARIPSLRTVELADSDGRRRLRVGSGITHAQIEDRMLPDTTHGLLPTVAATIAYRAVRNRGTLGGSIAHADPAADWVGVAALLDATMRLVGPQGERQLPAGEFFLGPFATALEPDELLVAVDFPVFSDRATWGIRKFCRKPGEFSEATAGVWIDPVLGAAHIVFAALDDAPLCLQAADELADIDALTNDPPARAALLARAGVDDPDRCQLLGEMLRRALIDAENRLGGTR